MIDVGREVEVSVLMEACRQYKWTLRYIAAVLTGIFVLGLVSVLTK